LSVARIGFSKGEAFQLRSGRGLRVSPQGL
jgi:hypothetical protein